MSVNSLHLEFLTLLQKQIYILKINNIWKHLAIDIYKFTHPVSRIKIFQMSRSVHRGTNDTMAYCGESIQRDKLLTECNVFYFQ